MNKREISEIKKQFKKENYNEAQIAILERHATTVTDKIIKTANIDREQITKNKEDIGKIQEDLDCKIDKVAVGEIELKFTNIGYVNASDGTISRSKEA